METYITWKERNKTWAKEWRDKKLVEQIEVSKKQKREIGFPENISYQKPFYEVKEGYGYEGIILCDKKTGEIQCHVCGAWFHWLQNHIRGTHKLKADEYRTKFKLGWTTALCSEKVRESLVRRAMTFPWERMQKAGAKIAKLSKEGKTHNKKWRERNFATLELKNKNGTCALQLLDQMERKSQELGRQPYAHEMLGDKETNMRQTIIKTFGSVKEMRKLLEMKGYMYIESKKYKYSDEDLLNSIRKFADVYKRRPSSSDLNRGLLYSWNAYRGRFGSWRNTMKLAFAETGGILN